MLNCFREIKNLIETNFKYGLFPLFSQEAIIKILKMRKKISNAQLQSELVEILKNMFLPSKKMIKEQIEWLIEHKYMKRDEDNINLFIYMAWKLLTSSCHCLCTSSDLWAKLDKVLKTDGENLNSQLSNSTLPSAYQIAKSVQILAILWISTPQENSNYSGWMH